LRRFALAAYYFPPAGWGGVQRPAKWARYLPDHGWEATILTVAPEVYEVGDPSLLGDLPRSARVLRTPPARLPWVGDPGLRWLPSLVREAGRLMQAGEVEAFLLTGSPFFPFLAGPVLKSAWGCPYVLDFRDPWTVSPWWKEPAGLKSGLKRSAARLVEAAAVHGAARCIFAHPRVAANYEAAYPGLAGGGAVVVPNGFDEAEFPLAGADPGPPPPREKYRILHTGTLDAVRTPALLLDALSRLKDTAAGRRLEASFVGLARQDVSTLAAGHGVGEMVSFEPYVPHDACVHLIQEADILWLDNLEARDAVAGKVFEYMASGRPILAAAHPGSSAARWLEESGTATVVGHDAAEVARGLAAIVHDLDAGRRPVPEREAVLRFGRRRQAARVAQVLEEACSS
jgi:glycosyltransferase involved in cell wall biosynthesis